MAKKVVRRRRVKEGKKKRLGSNLLKKTKSLDEVLVAKKIIDDVLNFEKLDFKKEVDFLEAESSKGVESGLSEIVKKKYFIIPIDFNLPFKEAKLKFKADFFRRELSKSSDISFLSKFLGVDRRTLHRVIKDLKLSDVVKAKTKVEVVDYRSKGQEIYEVLSKQFENYRQRLKEEGKREVFESSAAKFYKKLPEVSESIANLVPEKEMTWKEAKEDFERRFLEYHLALGENVANIAKKIGLRVETVFRKKKKLGI